MNPSPLSRRATLRELSRWAALLAAQRVAAAPDLSLPRQERPHFGADPFTLGVASGQPRPDSVILWTRLAPQPMAPRGGMPRALVALQWQVAEDEGFSRLRRSGTVWADPAQAHSVRVHADGLTPGRIWFYRFIAGNAVSPTGRTRTAPAEDAPVDRLRLVLASCQHYEQGWFVAQREIAGLDIDFVLFTGDYIYDNPCARRLRVRSHESGQHPSGQAFSLPQFRCRHAHYKLDPDLQAAHRAHPWILAWDDHEVRNDYAGLRGDDDFDLPPAEFVRVRAHAYQAYFEHLPLALDQQPGPGGMRMHDRFTWGRLAELWTLDGRQYRDVQACNDQGRYNGHLRWRCDAMDAPHRSMLGPTQRQWLQQGLAGSRRRWKLIGQSTQMSPWGLPAPDGRRLVFTDGWDGYAQERAALLGFIGAQRIDDVVVLGGDVHRHVAAQLRARPGDPRSPVVASEFVATSLTSAGMPQSTMSLIRRANPDILHARSDVRGYMQLEVTERSLNCIARATDFPVLPHSRMRTLARFHVEAGRPGPQVG